MSPQYAVGRLRLEVLHYGLDGLAQLTFLNELIAFLRGNAETEHEAHRYSLSSSLPLELKRGNLSTTRQFTSLREGDASPKLRIFTIACLLLASG